MEVPAAMFACSPVQTETASRERTARFEAWPAVRHDIDSLTAEMARSKGRSLTDRQDKSDDRQQSQDLGRTRR